MSSKIETLKTKVSTASADVEKKARELTGVRSKISRMKAELEKARQKRGYQLGNRELYEVEKQIRELESQIYNCETEELLKTGAELDDAKATLKEVESQYDLAKGEIVAQSLREEIRRYNQLLMDTAECQKKILSIFYTIPHRIRSTMGREDALKIPRLRMADVIFTQPEFKDQEPVRLFSMREWAIELTGLGESLFNPGELEFHEPKEW